MNWKWLIFMLWSLAQIFSSPSAFTQDYSFFVAGHTYGNPNNPQYGLYPPFVNKTAFINNYMGMAFGWLTGDVVIQPTSAYWNAAVDDIANFDIPLHIVAGNHDFGVEFEKRFGDYYYSFIYCNDLFIGLTPSKSSWNITGNQKDFLIATLDHDASVTDNIFVFLHELIWWSPDSIFQNVSPNYIPDYPGTTNFFTEIEPLFNDLTNQVVFFAGDVGATTEVSPFMYYKYDNITLIASGMGGGVEDNMVIVEVGQDTIIYHLIALNGDDINGLGELTDFTLDGPSGLIEKDGIQNPVFPNPVYDLLHVDCSITGPASKFFLTDLNGRVVLRASFSGCMPEEIPVHFLPGGPYLFRVNGKKGTFYGKILKL